jgi:transposase
MMNGVRYHKLLDDKLEFFLGQHGTSHFLQDMAPCNQSKIVSAWFQQRPHIKLVKCPINSPVFNPIETIWTWMKKKL